MGERFLLYRLRPFKCGLKRLNGRIYIPKLGLWVGIRMTPPVSLPAVMIKLGANLFAFGLKLLD